MPNRIRIGLEAPDGPEAVRLLEAADQRSASLYPAQSRHGLTAAALIALGVSFVVTRLDGIAVGCGGFVTEAPGAGELKRIFVAESARGQGLGAMVVLALETAARGRGIDVMRLETGVRSSEALRLYARLGYREREPFGRYRLDPLSIYMEKRL